MGIRKIPLQNYMILALKPIDQENPKNLVCPEYVCFAKLGITTDEAAKTALPALKEAAQKLGLIPENNDGIFIVKILS